MEVRHKPFLCLPFGETDYQISEGWRYSDKERDIHGASGHGGIDFAFPRGTAVKAAAEGWAIASYFGRLVKNKDGSVKVFYGKAVGMGLGYFVQIYHPQAGLYTSCGHLEKIADGIPFRKPTKRGDNFWPVGHKINPERFPDYKFARYVSTGDTIGFVGDSGLTWGYEDYPQRPNSNNFPSWDETHLHFEVFDRVGFRKRKQHFDPFGIKSNFEDYPDPGRWENLKNMGSKSPVLWLVDKSGLPKHP